MQHLGNIFLYNTSKQIASIYHQELTKRGYYVFDTDNLYKFSLYHKELTPDALLLDFDRQQTPLFINSIEQHFKHSQHPIIVVSETPIPLIYHPSISHYLTHQEAKLHLLKILQAYSVGNLTHHILYINLKPYEPSLFKKSALQKNYHLFEVNTLNAATQYLKKNTPKIICINFLPSLSKTQKLFSHPKTFYVENKQNIEEIEQFLN